MSDTNRAIQTSQEGAKAQIRFDGRAILMAEDMHINAEIFQELLAGRGAHVVHAKDGEQAVKLFTDSEAGAFDVILMDIVMPRMDGYEATQAIRRSAHPDADRIPIIAMTAYDIGEDRQRSLEAGLDEHLKKPVDPQILFRTIDTFIKNGRTAREWTEG